MSDVARSGLGVIFAFFLGLMVTAFFGVGVYTFHPPPERQTAEIRKLDQEDMAIRNATRGGELSAEQQARLQEIQDRRSELSDSAENARKPWGRSTSIALVILATLTMSVSLVRADQLPVISNGLLLGGLFTMIYGVGWIIATDTSVSRFAVMSAALVITLGLGYLRFVRKGREPASMGDVARSVPAGAGGAADAGAVANVADLAVVERRLRELEERLDGAASALGPRRPKA